MKICLDVEGVLADSHVPLVQSYNSSHNTNFSVSDITAWGAQAKLGLSEKELLDQLAEIWEKRWKEIPTTEKGLPEKVKALTDQYKVAIVTTRKVNASEIMKWLDYQGIGYHEFMTLEDNKSYTAKSDLNFDVWIDDNPHLAPKIASRKRKLLLYDRPYNKNVAENEYVARVKSFYQIINSPKIKDFLKPTLRL